MFRRVLYSLLIVCCAGARILSAQSDRDRALELYNSGDHLHAFPLLAKLAAADSNDRPVLFRYAFTVLENSKLLADSAARKAERAHARAVMARVLVLDAKDPLAEAFVRAIPVDGGQDVTYSKNTVVDAAMRRAEKAFAGGDKVGAMAGYRDALGIEPNEYNAATYLGDVFAQDGRVDSAIVWYRRAIAINPMRETAHRYMSDMFLKNKRFDEARDEAVEAMVAQPFYRLARQGFAQWAQAVKAPIGFPVIDVPPKDSLAHRKVAVAYDSVHRAWRGTAGSISALFQEQYPAETTYRASLAEEIAALKAAAVSGDSTLTTANITRLAAAGELEALVFFTRGNEGISHDYPGYVRDHHDALMRFWLDFVIGAKYVR